MRSQRQLRKLALVGSVAAGTLLAACSNSGGEPACSGDATVQLVEQVYSEKVDAALATYGVPQLQSLVKTATKVEVRDIATIGKDRDVGRLTCRATLSIGLPPEAVEAVSSANSPLSFTARAMSLTVRNDRIEGALEFTTQLTDDKRVSVESRGQDSVATVIATLALHDQLGKGASK